MHEFIGEWASQLLPNWVMMQTLGVHLRYTPINDNKHRLAAAGVTWMMEIGEHVEVTSQTMLCGANSHRLLIDATVAVCLHHGGQL